MSHNDEIALQRKLNSIPYQTKLDMVKYDGVDLNTITNPLERQIAKYHQEQYAVLRAEAAFARRGQGVTDRNQPLSPGPTAAQVRQQADFNRAAIAQAQVVRSNLSLIPPPPPQAPAPPPSRVKITATTWPQKSQPTTDKAMVVKAEQSTQLVVPQLQAEPQFFKAVGVVRGVGGANLTTVAPIAAADVKPTDRIYMQVDGSFQEVTKSAAIQAPQLPISPVTGLPSLTTAQVRRSLGLDDGGYQVPAFIPPAGVMPTIDAQRQAQIQQSEAARQASLPVSSVTGQPSEIAAQVRRSVGLP